MPRLLIAAATATLAFSGLATAQEAPFKMEIAARQGIMAYRAIQMGTLGGMAKGEIPYDAAAAQKAADNLLAVVALDASMLWPPGSDGDANPDSAALPALWVEGSGVGDKAKAMADAATAMQVAAGTGLDALKAAIGPVGGACAACHKAFRAPD